MFRLYVSSKDDERFGIKTGLTPVEFFLNSPQEVCDVIKALSSSKMIYTLKEESLSSVDDVKRYFNLID